MAYVICEPCVDVMDKACVDVCPVDCVYEAAATKLAAEDQKPMLYIHPDECIDCEACVPECPVEAIFHEDNLPEEWKEYTALNAEMALKSPLITEKKTPLAES